MEQGQGKPIARSIGYVVSSFMNRVDKFGPKMFERFAQMAIEEYSQYQMFHLPSVEVQYLTINDAGISRLPADFVKYVKVGVNVGGNLLSLTINRSMVKPRESECFTDINEATNASLVDVGGFIVSDHWHNGGFVSGLVMRGSGVSNNHFNIDEKNKTIWLSGPVPSREVIIEYIGSGTNLGAQSIIVPQAVEPLRNFLIWQNKEHDPKAGLSEKERLRKIYNASVEDMRYFSNMFTIQEYLESMYLHSSQLPN